MEETELERLVVRLTGDMSEYMSALKEAEAASVKGAAGIEAGLQPVEESTQRIGMGMRDARHALHMLALVPGLEHMAHPAMMGVYAYHMFQHTVVGVIQTLGVMKVAMLATPVGVLIAGVATLAHFYNKAKEEAKEFGATASAAFMEVSKGATTISDAIAKVGFETLSKGMKETLDRMLAEIAEHESDAIRLANRSERYRNIHGGTFDEAQTVIFEQDMAHLLERQLAARRMMQNFTQSVQGRAALETMGRAQQTDTLDRQTDSAHMQLRTLGLLESERTRLQVVQQASVATGRTEEQVLDELAFGNSELATAMRARIAIARQLEQAQAQQKLKDHVRDLEQTADRIGLNADAAARMAEAQRIVNATGLEMSVVLEQNAGLFNRMAIAQMRAAFGASSDRARQLEQETARLGMTADEATRFGMAQDFAARTGISLNASLMMLNPTLERIRESQEQIAAQRVIEEVRTPLEKYTERVRELDTLLANGRISWDVYTRAVEMAEKSLNGAAAAAGNFTSVGRYSADAMQRIAEYTERVTPRAYSAGGPSASAAFSAATAGVQLPPWVTNFGPQVLQLLAAISGNPVLVQNAGVN